MKVAIIFLDYQRHEHTRQTLSNLANANYPFDLFTINMKGISAAFNAGIVKAQGYDAYVTMSNDILMPDNWLSAMVSFAEKLPNTGIVGIHTVEQLPPLDANGVHATFLPFGNMLIMSSVIEKIGYFNTDHDPYGMQDSDFGYRADKAGFYNYYLPNLKAEHIGHDVGDKTDYRRMKDEGLNVALEKYNKWIAYYMETGNYYLPFNQNV